MLSRVVLLVPFLLGIFACGRLPYELNQQQFIQVRNPKFLGAHRLLAQRIPLGKSGDYKPCIARLPNGELLVVAFRQHEVGGGKYREDILLFRSGDGGRAWSEARILEGLLGREPYLTVLPNGTLLMTVHFLHIDFRNTEGYTYSFVHRSEDGGRTWTSTRVEPQGLPPKTPGWTTRNVLQLADGSLLMGLSCIPMGNDFIWRSTDGGRTWPEKYPARVNPVRTGYDYPGSWFGETVLWQTRSGKIYAIMRVDSRQFPPLPGRASPAKSSDDLDRMYLYASTDTGRTWQPVSDFGDYAEHYPAILRVRDGRVLLTFTVRSLKPPLGLRAVLGNEEQDGFQFDFEHDVLMLDTKTPVGRASGGGFGPTVQLDDDTLVSSYSYRGEDDKTHLEVVRWRLPLKGEG